MTRQIVFFAWSTTLFLNMPACKEQSLLVFPITYRERPWREMLPVPAVEATVQFTSGRIGKWLLWRYGRSVYKDPDMKWWFTYGMGDPVDTLFKNLQGFKERSPNSSSAKRIKTGIEGQVYSIGSPAVPIDWKPPPLERVITIVVVDDRHKSVGEFQTNEKGKFKIALPPGSYFLRVKESMFPAETGPFRVKKGKVATVHAHYDNGMR